MSSILKVAAALLCSGSLFCSVGLWVKEQNTILAMILAGVFASALELCKFAFFPAASKLFSQDKVKSIPLFFLAFILLAVSIVATVAFLETGSNVTLSKSLKSSATHQILTKEIKSFDQQIATVNGLLQADLENNYRKRAYDNSEKLALLRQAKNKSVDKLIHLKVKPTNGIHSLFATLSNKTGFSETSVRQLTYVIVAVLVDICGIACLLLLTVSNAKEKTATLEKTIANKTVVNESRKTNNLQPLRQKILDGCFGDKPVMRKIIEQEKVRHPDLKKLFIDMIKSGELRKVGKGVELAGISNEA